VTVILNLTWAIVLLPLVGVGVAFLAESPRRAAQTGIAFTGIAFAAAVIVLVFRLTHVVPSYENTETFWDLQSTSASAADARLFPTDFLVLWGIRVDPLSVSFMASTLLLSLAAQVHALASLRGDAGYRRFFWLAGLLTFGLLAMIASPNLFQFWLGWEVTAVAAWVLAAHHWQRPGVGVLSTRTFVVLTIADLALLLGLVMTFAKFGRSVGSLPPPPTGALSSDPFSFSVLATQWHLGHIGMVAGVGARTLVVLSVLFALAAIIRSAVGPFHIWMGGVLEAPSAGLALVAVAALVPAGLLIARLYPLLLEAPHVLTAIALVGTVGAAGAAALALAQRDLFRLGMFATASQGGLVLAAFGMGGFSPALFALFTASCLAVVYFLAAGNLTRAYRTRDIAECAGARRRLPRTTLALGAWAAGVSGLSLNTYSVLSATFRNTRPVGGGTTGTLTQVLVAAGVLVALALTALYAFRVFFLVAGGDAVRRRGFDITRLREAELPARRAVQIALAAAIVATLAGIPGVNSFNLGSRRVPGLTFTHFIFYGATRQRLAVDFVALALAAIIAAGGALAARWMFSPAEGRADNPVRARLARISALLAGPTPGERVATIVPTGFVRAGEVLEEVDTQLLEPIPDAMGESVALLSGWLARLRTVRIAVSTAAAFAVIAILLAASVLAVTGHFPVRIQ
jgi:NADH:ubiquinone oxidoreductase subunit 5 (subunit L)/multisubunit Na+/H+ antiporter MnhA subunit